jgi:flagellar basal body-associated protein FliL
VKRSKVIILILLISIVGFNIAASEEIPFVQELAHQLRERDWNEEEIEAFVEQSGTLSWNGIDDADAEVVAFALSYAKKRSAESGSEEQLLRARIALELARSSQEMVRLGISSQRMAASAVNGVRESLNRIDQLRNQETNIPDSVQIKIEEHIRTQVQNDMAFRIREENSNGRKPAEQPGQRGNPGPPDHANLPAAAGRK